MNPTVRRTQHVIRRHRERHMIGDDLHNLVHLGGRDFHNRRRHGALTVQGPDTATDVNIARLQSTAHGIHRLLARQPVTHPAPPISDHSR
jgi:biotin carboxylase